MNKKICRIFIYIFVFCILIVNTIFSKAAIIDIEKEEEITPLTEEYKNSLRMIFGTLKDMDEVAFGKYEQDNNLENGPEPIIWYCVEKDDENHTLTLMSKYILECKPFNTKHENVTWANCSLRRWLNYEFMDVAFIDDEKDLIIDTELKNPPNPVYNTNSGEDTIDKIYIMSFEEAIGFFEKEDSSYEDKLDLSQRKYNESRASIGTNHAILNGLRVAHGDYGYYNCGNYWLRTVGDQVHRRWYGSVDAEFFAAFVSEFGIIKAAGTGVHSVDDGVRPMLRVQY